MRSSSQLKSSRMMVTIRQMSEPEGMDSLPEAGMRFEEGPETSSAKDMPEGASSARGRGRKEATPVERALGLLTRREHSKQELARKLAARGIEPAQAKAAVTKLAEDGWQSDDRFAELLIRSRAAKGYGPLRIRAELATHGLDREAVSVAMEAFEGDWTEKASDLVRRRFGPGNPNDLAQRRKVADFLFRRGFDHDTVSAVSAGRLED